MPVSPSLGNIFHSLIQEVRVEDQAWSAFDRLLDVPPRPMNFAAFFGD
jgi:hypothetical protein